MKFPCPTVIDCPGGGDFPIRNYSSEGVDAPIFIGFSGGWGHYKPPLGSHWRNPDGFNYCLSTIGQADAQRCANNGIPDQLGNNGITDDTNPGDGGGFNNGGPNTGDFSSDQQQCIYTCPDGTLFVWTVAAGYARATSRTQADNIANSLACRLAIAHKICLSALDNKGSCADADFFATVKASVGSLAKLPLTWTIRSGSLPPGLDLDTDTGGDPTVSKTVGIIGHITAAASGDYNFLLRATDADGNFLEKSYKITVLKIAACPTNATPGIPYSFQMQTTGGVGPFVWTINGGSLPPGLTMDATGLITGTTTTVQAKYPVTIQVADSGISIACSMTCTLYNQCPGANLLDMIITATPNSVGNCGCPGCSANQNSMSIASGVCPPPPTNLESCDFSYQSTAFTSASAFTLRVTITVTGTVTGFAQHTMPLYKSGVLNQDLETGLTGNYTTGVHTVDFPLPAGTYTIGKGGINNARYFAIWNGTGGSINWTFTNKC